MRAFEECGLGARRQTEQGPRAGGIDYDDDDDCLEGTFSEDSEKDDA